MTPAKYLLAAAIGVGLALSCVQDGVGARPPNEEESAYAKLAKGAWEAEGMPSLSSECEQPIEMFVAHLETQPFEERCGRTYCNSPKLKEGEACAVGCLSNTTVGCLSSGSTAVIHEDYSNDINVYLHELMHRFSSCAGLGLDHNHVSHKIWQVILPELQMMELDTMTDGGVGG
jgi:hypothetical protein